MYEADIDLINRLLSGASLLKWLVFAAFLLHLKVRLKDVAPGRQTGQQERVCGTCFGLLGVIAILHLYPRYLLHKEMTLRDILNPFVDFESVYRESIEIPTKQELIANAADSFTLLSDVVVPSILLITTFFLFWIMGFFFSSMGNWRKANNRSYGGNEFDQPNYQIDSVRMIIMGFSAPLLGLVFSMLINQPILVVITGIMYVRSSSTFSNSCLRLKDEHLHQSTVTAGHFEFNGVPIDFIEDIRSYSSTHNEITITTPRKYRPFVQRCLDCRTNRGIYDWPSFRYVDGDYLSIAEPLTEEIYQRLCNPSPDNQVTTTIYTDVGYEQRVSHRIIERPSHLTVAEPQENSSSTVLTDLEGAKNGRKDNNIQSKPSVLEMDDQPKKRMINIED